MQYRQLGNSSLKVSLVGLGCNNFGGAPMTAPSGTVYYSMDLDQTRVVVDAAIDAGINLFDTADAYAQGGSERLLGELMKGRRDRFVLATKWGGGMEKRPEVRWGSRDYIRQACEASLQRLQTDYIDLYQMHWPDPHTPWQETLGALDELVREGKVRALGSSHLAGWQVAETDWLARSRGMQRMVAAQNHYSLLQRSAETELLPACEHFGVGLLPYFPLENGLLTGKYQRDRAPPAGGRLAGRVIDGRVYDLLEALAEYARQRGRSMLDVAIGALAAQPAVASIIAGATRVDQVRANAAAADWQLSAADMQELQRLLRQHPVPPVH